MSAKRRRYRGLQAWVDGWADCVSGWRKRRCPFYQQYALEWPTCLLPELDRRIALAPEHGFIWVRVPKAVNSTIARILWAAFHPGAGEPPRGGEAKRSFARPSALSGAQVGDLASHYKFMVVRNLFTRALAGYLDKSGHRKCGYKIRRRRPITPGESPVDFRGFCECLAEGGVKDDPHWCVQASLSPFPIEKLDNLGHVESLQSDLARILRALLPHRQNAYELIPAIHHATGASAQVAAYYGEPERRLIAQAYAEDFERFGYDPQRLPG